MSIAVFIKCVPPTTTAQQKGAFAVPGGGIRFFKKKKVKAAENTLWALLQPHAPYKPMTGPLSLTLNFVFPWRKSEKKARVKSFRTYPIETRPDVDNLFKLVGDVMTTLGYWKDDSQLSVLCVRKEYGERTGIGIVLTSATAEDSEGGIVSP